MATIRRKTRSSSSPCPHADGRLPGRVCAGEGTELGGAAVKAAWRAPASRRRTSTGVHGLRAARRPRPGAGAPGGARRRAAASRSRRPRSTRCAARACRRRSWPTTRWRAGSADVDRRRRHGEHDQRAVSAAQAPRRRAHRPRHGHTTTCSSTAWRTPTSRAGDGHLRRGDGRSTTSSPARPGRLRHGEPDPRQGGDARRRLRRARSSPWR